MFASTARQMAEERNEKVLDPIFDTIRSAALDGMYEVTIEVVPSDAECALKWLEGFNYDVRRNGMTDGGKFKFVVKW